MDPLLGSALGQHCVEQRGAVELCVPIAGTALGHIQPCPCCARPEASGTGIPPPLGARGSQPPPHPCCLEEALCSGTEPAAWVITDA